MKPSDDREPMTAGTLTDAAAAPAAMTAFLRGVERRAAVFAQLHCGDAVAGDNAVAGAMRAFRTAAGHTQVADWPRRFWSLLLAAPQLRQLAHAPQWPAGLASLGVLGIGPRAALLLRLAAGLSEADAAAVLGIARPSYRLAVQRALPHHADGSPDVQHWRELGAAVHEATRQLPVERLAHLARLREAAIQGIKLPRATRPVARRRPTRAGRTSHGAPRWLMPALWSALALCALGFVATFYLPAGLRLRSGDDDTPRIAMDALPQAEDPAARFSADTALLTHRDFELLQAAGMDAGVAATVNELDFFAWYAAQLASRQSADPTAPVLAADEPLAQSSGQADGLETNGESGGNDAPD